jgi:hypothetical protein
MIPHRFPDGGLKVGRVLALITGIPPGMVRKESVR